ncbi:hypothetical protein [Faecalibacterium prausnitzii]|uniref:Uncharacterized protein n=1 Tax=Faecalibacterium prausnitzii TaxID=853 RepID=A0A2A7AND9_9FIRM|nr:hypothetical protein [Faecalibacterium prausnitzii]PDX80551.1 hypothetical protein CGS58_10915 [Faecalibacterium prausnitzii]
MKKLKVDAVVLDLRHLTEETLAAYDKCEMEAVFALMNPHAQALLNQYGVKLDVVQSINGEDDVDVSTINGKATLDGTSIPDKKRAMVVNGKLYMKPDGVKALEQYCGIVVNGKLYMKPDGVKALEQYCGIVVNGKLYCPESLVSAVTAKCTVNGKVCIYPDDAVILNSTTKLDKTFLLRAQAKLYWAERMFVAVDPKLDAEALAAKGARFAAPKAILTESNAETLAPLFTEETELVILPDGTAFLDDDLELSASALRRNGDRLYVMGDVTIPEKAGELLEKIEYLHAEGTIFLPDTLEEAVDVIPELEYQELRVLHGHTLIGKPMLWLGKEMLDLYPDGVTCVDCAMVKLDKALEPDTIAKKFVFDGCAMVFCTELQQNAVSAVSKNVAQIQTGLAKEENDDTVRLDGIQLTL